MHAKGLIDNNPTVVKVNCMVGGIRQKSIIWSDVDQGLLCHMISVDDNAFMCWIVSIIKINACLHVMYRLNCGMVQAYKILP